MLQTLVMLAMSLMLGIMLTLVMLDMLAMLGSWRCW